MMRIIEKPWGSETILEQNEHYVVKKLFMKAGNKCSLQYHENKKETFYLLNGKMKFVIGDDINHLEEKYIKENDFYTIEPKTIHRMEAITDIEYLECSYNMLDDVVRLNDEYGRCK